MQSKLARGTFVLSLALGLSLNSPAVATAAAECTAESGLCVESGGTWQAGGQTTSRDRNKQSKKSAGSLTLRVEDGRGSVFINGRYAGTAPLSGVPIPSGKNDVQVRDGVRVLAKGLLTVPKEGAVVAVVR